MARPDSSAIYFVEDDFLHRHGARQALVEGLARSDYLSLYDHPDKYAGGSAIIDGGGEIARVIRTESGHWKTTTSATMTFATTRDILAADQAIWQEFSGDAVPYDFQSFVSLTAGRRSLIVPIPAFATHAERAWLAPGTDWTAAP